MGFYADNVAPRLINHACALPRIAAQRHAIVPRAQGTVVEIGFGSGLNLAHYDTVRITRLVAVDPAPAILALGRAAAAAAPFPVEIVEASAEAMPLPDAFADTVVSTYTMCSIPDLSAALAEIRRVLKPSGRLLFLEHGLADRPGVRRVQRLLTPLWRPLALGCRLDRDISGAVAAAGFGLVGLETFSLAGAPRFAGFHYRGTAIPPA